MVDRRMDIPAGVLGGVGLTHLTIYEDRPAPDGSHSGCAHVHAITDEAYYAVAGTGFLELHDVTNGYRRVALQPGVFVQFAPGTIHRAVSTGGLEVLVVIGNAGLAESGDARIYLGPDVDADSGEYRRLLALPGTKGRTGALERRDASVRAYAELMRLHDGDQMAYRAEVARFVDQHFRAMEAKRTEFEAVVREGPLRWAQTALDRLAALPAGAAKEYGMGASAQTRSEPVLGMCGTLRPVTGLVPIEAESAPLRP